MAVYCELNTVLQQIGGLKEVYGTTIKNETRAQVNSDYNTGSPLKDWMGYTRSLDQTPVIASKKNDSSAHPSQSSQASDAKGGAVAGAGGGSGGSDGGAKKKNVESIKWKAHVPTEGEKNPFRVYDVVEAPGESLLSSVITPAKRLHLKVFIALDNVVTGGPLAIRISDMEPISNVIVAAIHKYAEENRSPPLPSEEASAYLLRMAESDGSPDTDIPALNASVCPPLDLDPSFFHPSSFILHPSSFILHP